MTTAKTVHRTLASLKLPRPIPALIALAKSIVQSMTGNATFPTPEPPLATVTQAITDLETAQSAATARTHGAVAARNDKRTALVALLEQLRAYVQKIADANLDNAPAIIQSAGMNPRKVASRTKRVFAAKNGAVSGQVHLVTEAAARRASYDWEYSTDGGKTWQLLPSTLQAKTVMNGLQAATTVSFRYRAVTKTGETDWSQPISILVK